MLTLYKNIEWIFVRYGYTAEMFFAILIFACYLERKKHFIMRTAGCYCVVLMCYEGLYRILFGKNEWTELLFYILINMVIYLSLIVCFSTSNWSRLFVLVGACLLYTSDAADD